MAYKKIKIYYLIRANFEKLETPLIVFKILLSFLSCGNPQGLPQLKVGEVVWQTRLTKVTRCALLRNAGGAGFTRAFTAPPTSRFNSELI